MHAPDHPAPDDTDLDALMQDKLEAHCRQQLSALVDGALPPDQARFLLRRLQHDRALAGRWERWQVYGELMRGGVSQLLPADFSQRVCAALETQHAQVLPAVAARGARPAWTRWAGGAALAASVAMAALVVVQRDPQGGGAGADAAALQVASAGSPAAPPSSVSSLSVERGTGTGNELRTEAGTAAAAGAILLAAREAPRRAAARTGTARVASVQRSASTPSGDASIQAVATVNAPDMAPGAMHAQRDPFVIDVSGDARPWPRAVLPGVAQGGFSVGYGATSTDGGQFEYFEPRLPAVDGVQAQPAPQAEAGSDR